MRASQRGATLLEMMVTVGLMTIILGGIVMFLATHARMSAGAFDRTDIQRSGRGALTVLEEKLSNAGLGLPKTLAIKSYSAVDGDADACANSPKLEVAAVNYERQWSVTGTNTGIVTVDPTPEPSAAGDIAIDDEQWLFIYHTPSQDLANGYGTNRGHGMIQLGAARGTGDTDITIGSTNYSGAQVALDLASTAEISRVTGQGTVVLLADVSGFGMDCSNADHPYLYWENNGNRVPVASNVATIGTDSEGRSLGGVTGLSFRFLLDTTGADGVPDGVGDAWDATPAALTIDPAGNAGEQDNVTAIEVTLVLRSDTADPQLDAYRTETFTLLIQTPNIHTRVEPDDVDHLERYFFVWNTGI